MSENNNHILNIAICSSGEIWGGIEQFIYTYAKELKRHKYNFIVILFNKKLLYERLKESDIRLEVIQSRHKYDLTSILKIIKILRNNNINIVHTHGYKATILAGIAAKMYNVKLIKTKHGNMEPSKGKRYFKMSINYYLDKMLSRYLFDAVVFVSKDVHKSNIKYCKNSNSYVVYNGIAPINYDKVTVVDEMENEQTFNIGIIGRLSEIKGHIYLLKAIRQLHYLENIRLYVFGVGPLEDSLRDYCNKNHLSKKVHFMGFQKNMHRYMSKLELLVLPSLHEGLPYTLLEGMYSKVPIVATAVGGLKEVLVNNYNGILVPPKDKDALARSIEKIYKNQGLRRTLIHNAFKEVSKNYLINAMVEKYLNIYQNQFNSRRNHRKVIGND